MTLWAYRSRALERLVKRHLDGIVTAVVDKATNARAESINAGIQKVKYSARGLRTRKRFRSAIYFHLGGLDLYPVGVTRRPTLPPGFLKAHQGCHCPAGHLAPGASS